MGEGFGSPLFFKTNQNKFKMRHAVKSRDRDLMAILGYRNGYAKPEYTGEEVIFRSLRQREGGKMTGNFQSIPGVDRILIPKFERNEEGQVRFVNDSTGKPVLEEAIICYVPGARSIFLEEIMEYSGLTEKEIYDQRVEDLQFHDSVLIRVGRHEVNKLAYLRATNLNRDIDPKVRRGVPTFYELNKEKLSENRRNSNLDKATIISQVTSLIQDDRKETIWVMFAALRELTLAKVRDRFTYSEAEDYVLLTAMRKPEKVAELMKPEMVQRMSIMQAVESGHLTVEHDGAVKTKSDETIAMVGNGGNVIDSVMNMASKPQIAEIVLSVRDVFAGFGKAVRKESGEVNKLKAQIAEMKEAKDEGVTLSEKVTGAAMTAKDPLEIEDIIRGLCKGDEPKIELGMNRWVKDLKGNDFVPSKDLNDGKTWDIKTLGEFFSQNPDHYKEFLEKVA